MSERRGPAYIAQLEAVENELSKLRLLAAEEDGADPGVMTAWVAVLAEQRYADDGRPESRVFMAGPETVPYWQDVGLLKVALEDAAGTRCDCSTE